MSALIPFLWFNDQAEEAARYYVGIFPGAKLGEIQRFPANSRGPEGGVMTASFTLGDQLLVALNGNPRFGFSPAMSLLFSCASGDEAATVAERLAAGGEKQPGAGCATSTECRGRYAPIVSRGLRSSRRRAPFRRGAPARSSKFARRNCG